jgi:hypothetical protein
MVRAAGSDCVDGLAQGGARGSLFAHCLHLTRNKHCRKVTSATTPRRQVAGHHGGEAFQFMVPGQESRGEEVVEPLRGSKRMSSCVVRFCTEQVGTP